MKIFYGWITRDLPSFYALGAVALVPTLDMALGPPVGGWLFDTYGSCSWLYLSSFAVGLAAVAIASTFRPPGHLVPALPSPSPAG